MADTREARLRIVASGKCRSASRNFGGRLKYLPSIGGMICQLSEEEEDCYHTSKEAVAAAEAFREEARQKLQDEFGR
ncbi:hypothetical protein SAMN05444163_8003 [Bradyrhizobium ottawaense]|uniref:Uncharacterized protein n=1 Tax=Bradyrhizobium ottawaense TaxID=931866 RepID=A0ABY0QH16_9BRAD|nr:hypothetical protein SAMN05444163_8003 [Bradyrhizobium ottawaense]